MSDTPITQSVEPQAITQPSEISQPEKLAPKTWRQWMAVLATIVTVAAWILLGFVELWPLILAVVGVVAGALGVGSRLRTLSITALLAAAVLCLVYALFYGAIAFILHSI